MIFNIKKYIILFFFHPFIFIWKAISKVICKIRSIYYTLKIDSGGGRIVILNPFLSIIIKKSKKAKLVIKGNLQIDKYLGGNNPVFISLSKNSKLEINGDFVIGHGTRFLLDKNSKLIIGGKDKETVSGITSDTMILVRNKITIGTDFLCAWNVLITDSDWHSIIGSYHQKDVYIGNHVWIANSSSVLKGSIINNNCIIASNTKIIKKEYLEKSMIAGTPSRVIKKDVEWSREMIEFNMED